MISQEILLGEHHKMLNYEYKFMSTKIVMWETFFAPLVEKYIE